MSVRYIFDTNGEYKAFVTGGNLFTPDCDWIGFIINGNEVYSSDKLNFVGYVLNDDRIARKINEFNTLPPLRPTRPMRPMRPMRPLRRLRMARLPYPYEDVFLSGFDLSKRLVSQSRISGEFEGWDGDSVYKLDNGQKWQQATYQYKYIYKYRPRVKIWQDGGRYYMEVEGDTEMIEVQMV